MKATFVDPKTGTAIQMQGDRLKLLTAHMKTDDVLDWLKKELPKDALMIEFMGVWKVAKKR